jgi:hypothetical protein
VATDQDDVEVEVVEEEEEEEEEVKDDDSKEKEELNNLFSGVSFLSFILLSVLSSFFSSPFFCVFRDDAMISF